MFLNPRLLASLFLPIAALFLLSVPAFALLEPGGRVSDFAGVLTTADQTYLRSIIRDVEDKTTAELFVVTVASLEGMSVEEYANKLFNQWGIGKKGKDNGLLVLVSPSDRKMRIEVGYGLEGTIPDGLAGEVIRKVFIPYFKKGDYASGIVAGVKQLSRFVEGTENAADWKPAKSFKTNIMSQLGLTAFLSIFVVIGLIVLGYGFGHKVIFCLVWGLMFGGIPLFMAYAAPELAGWPRTLLVFLAGAAAVLGFWLGHKHPKFLKVKGKVEGNHWIWGASSGGSGGGFSGGGSSGGGGGSSGGGGASGSW